MTPKHQTLSASRAAYESFAAVFDTCVLNAAYGDGRLKTRAGYVAEPERTEIKGNI